MHRRIPTIATTLLIAVAVTTSLLACKGDSADSASTTTARTDAARPAAGTTLPNDSVIVRADQGRILGPETATVWVIEVSDFQCPYCAAWHNSVYDDLKREFIDTGKIRFAYINYPLPNHPHAWPAAFTAMCAAEQGKFWPVHSAIFRTHERWNDLPDAKPVFDSLAVAAGVDASRLRACIESERPRSLIQADMDRAIAAGVNATPSFIIGETRLSGLQPLERIRTAIEAELAKTPTAGR